MTSCQIHLTDSIPFYSSIQTQVISFLISVGSTIIAVVESEAMVGTYEYMDMGFQKKEGL